MTRNNLSWSIILRLHSQLPEGHYTLKDLPEFVKSGDIFQAMRWFAIRKATIDDDLRAAFEQYGVSVMQLNLALGDFIKYNDQIFVIKDILGPLTQWLTEQYDRAERKETWSLTMEIAITVFVLGELLMSVLSFFKSR